MSGAEGQVDTVSTLVEVLAEWSIAQTVGYSVIGGAEGSTEDTPQPPSSPWRQGGL